MPTFTGLESAPYDHVYVPHASSLFDFLDPAAGVWRWKGDL